ncbi:MAG TPA: class F sortase [Dehalococcoidia bacterium]
MVDRLARATLALSLAALALTAGLWLRADQSRTPDAGSLAGLEPPGPSLEAALAALPPAAADAPDPVVARPARLEDLSAGPVALPVSLTIPAIGVDAPVVPVGLASGGTEVALPPDGGTVGWYRHGPVPGEAGAALLVGHVDLYPRQTGVFFRLRYLEPGERLAVRYSDGSERRFEVVARRTYRREELPADLVFAREGEPVLALVTCGGDFDRAGLRYGANVVVVAVPAP